MNNRFIFNPFVYIAGFKSLIIGLVGLCLTSFLAYITGTHFNGFIHVEFAKDCCFWVYLLENVIQWIAFSVVLYLAGLMLSKSKIRLIDVFGTILLSRIPLLIVPVFRLFPFFQSFVIFSTTMYLLVGVYIVSFIWFVVLSFNAYKISCNLKNDKLLFSFFACLVISEVLIKLVLYLTV